MMQCKVCKGNYIEVSNENVKAVTCGSCVAKLIEWPTIGGSKSTGRPRGWKFMKEFVDKDGNVFHKGIEQPELKGTLSPTKIKKKTKKKKKEPYIDMKMVAEYKKKQKEKKKMKEKNANRY